ncbi:hypothetical protein B0H13DRAFT_2043911 [Mycena leptocephala]|nr:hypothetical protein B0H13DRAFT_2043911 [Mycena leptocephala]
MTSTDLRRRLKELGSLIAQQKLYLDELERDRVEVEHQLFATATFPIEQLPIEITTEIFLRIPVFKHFLNANPSYSTTPAPLAVASVCRSWREIALSTPALWSKLDFEITRRGDPDVAERYLRRWLDRAASRPLSLGFSLGRDVGEDCEFPPERLRDLIRSYSGTIQHLILDMYPEDLSELGLDSMSFPILRSAGFGSYRDLENPLPGPALVPQVNFMLKAPLLDELRFPTYCISCYTFPWSQLTKFEGDLDTMDLFVSALNLTEISCSVVFFRSPTSVITHTRLRSLTLLESADCSKSQDIIQYLTLPALQLLNIADMEDTTYASLHPFLSRSSPPLLNLAIRLDDNRFRNWEACVDCVGSTLENLALESPSIEVQLSLFYQPFPNLRTLSLFTSPSSPIIYPDLCDFLDELPRLSSFRLGPTLGLSARDLNQDFANLIEKGMNISVATNFFPTITSPVLFSNPVKYKYFIDHL